MNTKKPKNILEIFKLLEKSNCRQCGEKTCLAFAQAVFMGNKPPEACPKLDGLTIELLTRNPEDLQTIEKNGYEYLTKLKGCISGIDLASAAKRIGAQFSDNRLTLKVLGKDFSVDKNGDFAADIHINPWIGVPYLNYVLYGQGITPCGEWVSFRELQGGRERYLLFHRRCELSLRNIADTHTSFFDDMIHLFGGKQVQKKFKSDISVVLQVLPRIPLMICYWYPEDGIESGLHIFFDKTADRNLDIDSIDTLVLGLTHMFTKLTLRHGAK